jgi:hypothetical protein
MTASTPTPPTAPRFSPLWAMLTCALAALTLAHPALGGQFLVSGISDQYIAGHAFRDYAANTLRAGDGFPLWNPYLFGGMPYVAAMHGDIFYPTFLLRLLLGTDAGMTWGMVLHLWLAGVFTYAFLRSTGLSFWASLIGGLAYMMSGPIAGLVSPGHDGKLFVSALFPLMLLCLTWGIRDGKQWAWGALALVSGLGVLTPHPQLYQYMLIGAGAYGLMLAYGGEQKLAGRVAVTRLGASLGAVLVGWLIGAIQFVPVAEYVDWSPRAGGKGWDHAVSYSMPPEELINGYLPQFSGILDDYWGRNGIHFHSDYLGVAVLMLAIAGFAWGRRKEAWFWLGFLTVAVLWSLGGFTPFYSLVYWIVPGAKFFRAPSTIFYLAQFAIAVFAARGAERLLTEGIPRRHLYGWLGFGLLMILLATTGALRDIFLGVVPDQRMAQFTDATARAAMGIGALRSFFVVLAVGGLVLALEARRLAPTFVAAALVALMVGDFWSIERRYWQFSAPASELYKTDAIIEHIKAQPEPGRVLSLLVQTPPSGRDPFLGGDAYMVHGLRLVTGYHGNQIGRYDKLYGAERQMQNLFNPVFWQVSNMKWIVYNDSTVIFPGTERVMGPVLNAAGTPIWLFKVPGENPAAWVTPAIMKQPDDVVESALNDPRFPAISVALFAPDAPVEGQQLSAAPAPLPIKTRTVVEPGHIVVELDSRAPAGSALMVAENYYPGWTATIDGQPAAVHRADLSLMGVPLTAGATKMELRFSSASYERGKLITLIGIGLALLLIGAGAIAQRRVARA